MTNEECKLRRGYFHKEAFLCSQVFTLLCFIYLCFMLHATQSNNNNNNNNNQYIYKQRQSHAMSQRRWLATAVIFRPSDVSLGFLGNSFVQCTEWSKKGSPY